MNATRTETTNYEIYEVKTSRGTFLLSETPQSKAGTFLVTSGRTMHPSRINGVDWFLLVDGKFIPKRESNRTFSIEIK